MYESTTHVERAAATYRAADKAVLDYLIGARPYNPDAFDALVVERLVAANQLALAAEWMASEIRQSDPLEVFPTDAQRAEREDAADHDDWDVEPWSVDDAYPEEQDAYWGYAH